MTSPSTKVISVPMEVTWPPGWLSWVSSTTACLNALGIACDQADVAGQCGYAFSLSVHRDLCPSGPTVLDWGSLESGVHLLGRSTLAYATRDCHTGEHANDRTRAHCRTAFDLARREVEAGRPCVVWGAYVPEFAAVVGVENDSYLVKSCRQAAGEDEAPIPYDGLDAPGGPYVLAFPTPTDDAKRHVQGDRLALGQAVQKLRATSPWGLYAFGLAAYDLWIDALEHERVIGFGNAYNAQCYAEGRAFAHVFLERMTERGDALAEPLARATEAYGDTAAAMRRVAELFPFPGDGEAEDPATRAQAVEALRDAKRSETAAAEALEDAIRLPSEV